MNIVQLSDTETLPIRQAVLWPDKPQSFCQIAGDEDAMHFGVINDNNLVCVASIYLNGETARLRKFATLQNYQKQGIGSSLIKHILSTLPSSGVSHLWCDVRESAIIFYKKFGFEIDSDKFYKNNIPFFKMSKSIHLQSEST